MQNSMSFLTFFGFNWKLPFWGFFFSSEDNFHFKLKFGTKTNPNIQISMMVFSFSIFDGKYTFGSNLIKKKIKIVSLNWNLVPRLIPISKIWWRIQCSLFLCQTKNTLFRQIRSKKKELSVQAEIWYLDYFEYAEFNAVVFFFCFRSEKLILSKIDTKNQNF